MSIHIGPYTFDQVRCDPDADVLYLPIGDGVDARHRRELPCEGRHQRRVFYHATTRLTVPQAARRTGRNPETIRRWIREGKVGTQHVIEERDLQAIEPAEMLPVPTERGWEKTF
jgi:hypothetical protein